MVGFLWNFMGLMICLGFVGFGIVVVFGVFGY